MIVVFRPRQLISVLAIGGGDSSGKASYSLTMRIKGLRSIKVVYAGSSVVNSSTSPTNKIRVR